MHIAIISKSAKGLENLAKKHFDNLVVHTYPTMGEFVESSKVRNIRIARLVFAYNFDLNNAASKSEVSNFCDYVSRTYPATVFISLCATDEHVSFMSSYFTTANAIHIKSDSTVSNSFIVDIFSGTVRNLNKKYGSTGASSDVKALGSVLTEEAPTTNKNDKQKGKKKGKEKPGLFSKIFSRKKANKGEQVTDAIGSVEETEDIPDESETEEEEYNPDTLMASDAPFVEDVDIEVETEDSATNESFASDESINTEAEVEVDTRTVMEKVLEEQGYNEPEPKQDAFLSARPDYMPSYGAGMPVMVPGVQGVPADSAGAAPYVPDGELGAGVGVAADGGSMVLAGGKPVVLGADVSSSDASELRRVPVSAPLSSAGVIIAAGGVETPVTGAELPMAPVVGVGVPVVAPVVVVMPGASQVATVEAAPETVTEAKEEDEYVPGVGIDIEFEAEEKEEGSNEVTETAVKPSYVDRDEAVRAGLKIHDSSSVVLTASESNVLADIPMPVRNLEWSNKGVEIPALLDSGADQDQKSFEDVNSFDIIGEDVDEYENEYRDANAITKVVEKPVIVEKPVEVIREVVTIREVPAPPVVVPPVAPVGNAVRRRNGAKVIIVTGDRKSGVTRVAVNLANRYAKQAKTLFVDMDIRRKGALMYLGLDDILSENEAVQNSLIRVTSAQALTTLSYKYLRGGFDCLLTAHGEELEESNIERTQMVLTNQREYDYIVVDCPMEQLHRLENLLLFSEILITTGSTLMSVYSMVTELCGIEGLGEDNDSTMQSLIMSMSQFVLTDTGTVEELETNLNEVCDMFDLKGSIFDVTRVPVVGTVTEMQKIAMAI